MNIPVIMMFDDNYIIPAAVAIYSMLSNADTGHNYDIRIIYKDITDAHKDKLNTLVERFPNASILFHKINCTDLPDRISGWPQEIIYKLLVAELFPDVDKAIVTDVDVVFEGDVSKEFIDFDSEDYCAMVKEAALPWDKPYSSDVTDDNIHFMYGAGYMIYNCKAMRRDNMPKKYIDFMYNNLQFLKLPDQEILNIVSNPKIKELHPRNMVLVTWYRINEWVFDKYDYNSTAQEHHEALSNPVQLHYVGYKTWGKPWYDPNAPCAEIWFRYLTYTNFFDEYYSNLFNQIRKVKSKRRSVWKWFK